MLELLLLHRAAACNDKALLLLLNKGDTKRACGLLSRALGICKKLTACFGSPACIGPRGNGSRPGQRNATTLDEHMMRGEHQPFRHCHHGRHHFVADEVTAGDDEAPFMYSKVIFLQESCAASAVPWESLEVYTSAIVFNLALVFQIFPECESSSIIRRQKALELYNLALRLHQDDSWIRVDGGNVLFTLAIVNNMAILLQEQPTNHRLSDQGREYFEYLLANLIPTAECRRWSKYSAIVLAGFMRNALTYLAGASSTTTSCCTLFHKGSTAAAA
jgi:tetratricopeptide (TPR) repeat protein